MLRLQPSFRDSVEASHPQNFNDQRPIVYIWMVKDNASMTVSFTTS